MKHEAFLENDLVEATSMFIRAGQALEKGLNKLGHVFYQQIVGDAFYKLLGKWKYWTQGRIAICSRSFFWNYNEIGHHAGGLCWRLQVRVLLVPNFSIELITRRWRIVGRR